jgi:hypothetical protein
MKERIREQIGKYSLDLSKMIFGGVVISAIMKEDINLATLLLFGAFAVTATATAGFVFLSIGKGKSNN